MTTENKVREQCACGRDLRSLAERKRGSCKNCWGHALPSSPSAAKQLAKLVKQMDEEAAGYHSTIED